ncbi:MAG: hypothetical protein FWE62_01995, partial [Firmicutes bacterium]|nr:hypothetical protein [Bacillota bacterium]
MNRTELDKIIKTVFDLTGLKVVLSAPEKLDTALVFDSGGLAFDRAKGATYFKFYKGGEEFVGRINGADSVSANYALLISQIFGRGVSADSTDKYRQLLRGNLPRPEAAYLVRSLGISGRFYMLTLVCKTDATTKVMSYLRTLAEAADMIIPMSDNIAYLKSAFTGDDYKSVSEFAAVLAE